MKTKYATPLLAAGICALTIASLALARQSKPRASGIRSARSVVAASKGVSRPDAAARSKQLAAYEGTRIAPRLGVSGDELRMHEAIGARFAERDPAATAARIGHFAWLDDPQTSCKGWHGIIQDVATIPGGFRVAVRVSPTLKNEGLMAIHTPYYVVETYELKAGQLSLLGVEGPPAGTLKAVATD